MAVIHYRGGFRIDPSAAPSPRGRDGTERTALRIYLFSFAATLWLLIIVVRMADLQIRQAAAFTEKALKQQEGIVDVRASRGAIYDRFGEELALSTPVDSIGVFPDKVRDPALTAALLSEILGMDRGAVIEKLRSDRFQWIKRLAEPGEAERVRHLNLPSIHFEKESKRYYPKGTVASHILGAVGIDHEGLAGLEQTFEDLLRGQPGQNLVQYDALRNGYASRILKEPVPGSDLILTIDQRIQMLAERELRATIEERHAQAGTVVVMDPHNGDLLAVANWPTFDPNERVITVGDLQRRRNYAISNLIEPGSTFKLVTLSAVLEEGLTTPQERLFCENGLMYVGRRPIRDHKPYGMLTVEEVLAHSSNIGAVKLAMRLREPRFYEYIRRFGFGESTGIPLPGEIAGLLRPVDQWQSSSLASIAFGQEIGVTALQMARATSAIANGGLLVRPRLVEAVVQPGGERQAMPEEPARRILTANTAALMRGMMERVVEDGTGLPARLAGYRVAGKTGTAQKIDPDTGAYSPTDHIANFVGFTPVNDPSIVIVIAIDSPVGEHYGTQVAAPIFPRIAAQALRFRDVPPQLPIAPQKRPKPLPPETLADSVNEPWVEETSLAPQSPRGDAVLVTLGDSGGAESARNSVQQPRPSDGEVALQVTDQVVPDFRGRTVREVIAESAALGLRANIQGRGVALRQWPAPGTPVAAGAAVRIAFSRSIEEVPPRR